MKNNNTSPEDVINQLLQKWQDNKYDLPVAVLDDDVDITQDNGEGFQAALFLFWSVKTKVLEGEYQTKVEGFIPNNSLSHSALTLFMRNSIGDDLYPNIYRDKYKDFVVDYLSFSRSWKYNYYEDIAELFPETAEFFDIEQTSENYEKILGQIDLRLKEWELQL